MIQSFFSTVWKIQICERSYDWWRIIPSAERARRPAYADVEKKKKVIFFVLTLISFKIVEMFFYNFL